MLEEPRRARVLGARLGRARGRNFGWRMPNKGCREAVCAFGRGVRAGRAALGRAMGRGKGFRFAAFTLVDAPKNGFTLDPQIWVKPTSKFLPSECQPAQQSNRFGITMNSLSRTSQ